MCINNFAVTAFATGGCGLVSHQIPSISIRFNFYLYLYCTNENEAVQPLIYFFRSLNALPWIDL